VETLPTKTHRFPGWHPTQQQVATIETAWACDMKDRRTQIATVLKGGVELRHGHSPAQ